MVCSRRGPAQQGAEAMLLKNLNIEIPDIPAAAAPAWRNAQRLLREAIDPVRAEPGNEHLGTIELVKIAASRGNEFAAEVVRGLDNPAFQELMRNVASAAAFFGW